MLPAKLVSRLTVVPAWAAWGMARARARLKRAIRKADRRLTVLCNKEVGAFIFDLLDLVRDHQDARNQRGPHPARPE